MLTNLELHQKQIKDFSRQRLKQGVLNSISSLVRLNLNYILQLKMSQTFIFDDV
jgi:hypothetical protein